MTLVICLWFLIILNRDYPDHFLAYQHRHCQPALRRSAARDQPQTLNGRFHITSY